MQHRTAIEGQDSWGRNETISARRLLFKSAAREKVLSGATALVRITLGPKSKCVLIQKKWGRPIVSNDGITIAKEVELEDPEGNVGAQMIREEKRRLRLRTSRSSEARPEPR
jgi:chaperonin GroEL (HSP60 family)